MANGTWERQGGLSGYLSQLDDYAGGPLSVDQLNTLTALADAAPTERFLTPDQIMSQYTVGARPYMRQDLWRTFDPLYSRFQLSQFAAPGTPEVLLGDVGYDPNNPERNAAIPALNAAGFGNTFADYLGAWGGGRQNYGGLPFTPMSRDEMLRRAQTAAAFGRQAPLTIAEMIGGPRSDEAFYGYQTYGGGAQAAENQLRLATQLALTPRSGTGYSATGNQIPQYSGLMQQAIQGAMQDIFTARRAIDPEERFLDWYLGRIDPKGVIDLAGLNALYAPGNGNGNGNNNGN